MISSAGAGSGGVRLCNPCCCGGFRVAAKAVAITDIVVSGVTNFITFRTKVSSHFPITHLFIIYISNFNIYDFSSPSLGSA